MSGVLKFVKKSLKFRIRANTAKTVSKTPLAVSGTKSDNVLISWILMLHCIKFNDMPCIYAPIIRHNSCYDCSSDIFAGRTTRSADLPVLFWGRFFASQGRHVAAIKVKVDREERIKFHLDRFRDMGIRPKTLKIANFVNIITGLLRDSYKIYRIYGFMRVHRLHNSAKFGCFNHAPGMLTRPHSPRPRPRPRPRPEQFNNCNVMYNIAETMMPICAETGERKKVKRNFRRRPKALYPNQTYVTNFLPNAT